MTAKKTDLKKWTPPARDIDAVGSPGPFEAVIGPEACDVFVMSAPAPDSRYGHFVAKVHPLNAGREDKPPAGQAFNARLLAASWDMRLALKALIAAYKLPWKDAKPAIDAATAKAEDVFDKYQIGGDQ